MMRYLRRKRAAGLAGLAGLATIAALGLTLTASPAFAEHFHYCPPGTDNPVYCTDRPPIESVDAPAHVEHQKHFTVKVDLRYSAKLTIELLYNGKVVGKVVEGTKSGKLSFTFTAPAKKGTYVIRVIATVNGSTQTVNKTLIVG